MSIALEPPAVANIAISLYAHLTIFITMFTRARNWSMHWLFRKCLLGGEMDGGILLHCQLGDRNLLQEGFNDMS